MVGKYDIRIRYDDNIVYELTVERKITILQGNSGTGKTTFFEACIFIFDDIVEGKLRAKKFYHCEDMLYPLTKRDDWELLLETEHNRIFVLDENTPYLYTRSFAKALNASDNYFIIIARDRIPDLTYSVESIYYLKTEKESESGEHITRAYSRYQDEFKSFDPAVIVCEDSKSGYEMTKLSFPSFSVESARGRKNINNTVKRLAQDYSSIYVIADGEAFGSNITKLFDTIKVLSKDGVRVLVFLPPSFEWVLLKHIAFAPKAGNKLTEPYNFCDVSRYPSREAYYTDLLKDLSAHFDFKYDKGMLQSFFRNRSYLDHYCNIVRDLSYR